MLIKMFILKNKNGNLKYFNKANSIINIKNKSIMNPNPYSDKTL